MKLLVPLPSLDPLGGVEQCVLQDCIALTKLGHEIVVAYEFDGALREIYEQAGVELRGPYRFRSCAIQRPFYSVSGLRAPMRLGASFRPDAVWLNRFEHILWGQAAARSAGCSLICHLHGVPWTKWVRQLSVGVEHFVAVSEFVRTTWIEAGLGADRVSTVYNAIATQDYPFSGDPELQSARRNLDLPTDIPIVLYCGSMTAEKGLVTLLRAWRELATRRTALLVLVGAPSPSTDPAVADELRQLPESAYRYFPLAADVVPFMQASDLLVFPSLLPEAFGRVLVEAMSTGRPAIGSSVGGVPEVLSGPMSRFLVMPDDAGQLADRIDSVLDWRHADPGLGAACAGWVAERFPYQAHVTALEDAIRSQLRPRRRLASLAR